MPGTDWYLCIVNYVGWCMARCTWKAYLGMESVVRILWPKSAFITLFLHQQIVWSGMKSMHEVGWIPLRAFDKLTDENGRIHRRQQEPAEFVSPVEPVASSCHHHVSGAKLRRCTACQSSASGGDQPQQARPEDQPAEVHAECGDQISVEASIRLALLSTCWCSSSGTISEYMLEMSFRLLIVLPVQPFKTLSFFHRLVTYVYTPKHIGTFFFFLVNR